MTVLTLISRRLLAALPTLAGVLVITFVITRTLPGDPAAFFAGPAASQEAVGQIREKLGLNRSLPVQFGVYLRDLARGDLGPALTTGQPVRVELAQRLPASLELTACGLGFALLVGVPLGIAAATRPGSWLDHGGRLVSTLGVSLPSFFLGLLLIYVFYYRLGWAPAPLGRLDAFVLPPEPVTHFLLVDALLRGEFATFRAAAAQLALPALTVGLFALAPLTRMTRAAMIEALASDYVRAARAAGLSRARILLVYALHNALLPVVTTLGMVFSYLLGINVLVEKVFAWPGLGSFSFEALLAGDYHSVQGFILTMGGLFVLLNLAVDLLYGLIDPRVARSPG
ncbi:MAG: ABC transporter permease [Opitutaceae bacterium]|nr:ABC transporter permease [Opitutaceae bacterium]